MGRHSAPDDDDEPEGSAVLAADPASVDAAEAEAAARRGRHNRGEDVEHTGPVPGAPVRPDEERAAVQDDRPTEQFALADLLQAEPEPEPEAAPPEPAAAPAKPARATQSTSADLALIRRHGDVRNRVLGAVLVPFVLYLVTLLLLSARGMQYLVWVWIPMVTAGVLVGFVLDAGHKRYPSEPAP